MRAHESAQCIAVMLASIVLSATSAFALSDTDARCRSHLDAGVSKLTRDTMAQLVKCHDQRLRGQIPAATDCSDPANAPSPLHIARTADSLADRAARRCDAPPASAPAALGFSLCAAPCDAEAPTITDYGDVAACLTCRTSLEVSDLIAAALGAPPAPGDTERQCHRRLGLALRTYLGVRLAEQRDCQEDKDVGAINSAIDCRTADLRARVAVALVRLRNSIARCTNAELASLDSCSSTVPGEQVCLPALADATANSLFDAVYNHGALIPTVPPSTPTSTPTHTPAVPTNTPTQTRTPTVAGTETGTPTATTTPFGLLCGNNVIDSGEDCDDGGICAGGSDAGDACTAESDCDAIGVCLGGGNALHACFDDGDCPAGQCRRCRPFGGDGCAQNCTFETDVTYPLEPGTISGGSNAVLHTRAIASLRLPLGGAFVMTAGAATPSNDQLPFVVKADDFGLNAIRVGSLACACARAADQMTCGGVLVDEFGDFAGDCTPGFNGAVTCPPARPCASVHGPGNAASGIVGCSRLGPAAVSVTQDCNGLSTPFDPVYTYDSEGDPGTAVMISAIALGISSTGDPFNKCSGDPNAGPDQAVCTVDDPLAIRGSVAIVPFTTLSVTALVQNADGPTIADIGPFVITGAPFTCSAGTLPNADGAAFVGATTACDTPTLGDQVTTYNLQAQ